MDDQSIEIPTMLLPIGRIFKLRLTADSRKADVWEFLHVARDRLIQELRSWVPSCSKIPFAFRLILSNGDRLIERGEISPGGSNLNVAISEKLHKLYVASTTLVPDFEGDEGVRCIEMHFIPYPKRLGR